MKLLQMMLFSLLMGIAVSARADDSRSAECKSLKKQACITEGKVDRARKKWNAGGDDTYDRDKGNWENLKDQYEDLLAELRANNCGVIVC